MEPVPSDHVGFRVSWYHMPTGSNLFRGVRDVPDNEQALSRRVRGPGIEILPTKQISAEFAQACCNLHDDYVTFRLLSVFGINGAARKPMSELETEARKPADAESQKRIFVIATTLQTPAVRVSIVNHIRHGRDPSDSVDDEDFDTYEWTRSRN
ncbi:hypothetical protein CC85DRAFT_305854 [Cutaneotrichosporon oleaginosum]|uniref:Uncharacterized protein n=1 Tax=Cutaneotrichosporon oleaginosum TaxID=879819 RepID=A0A0J0XBV8_9TREE|nr:uncharacterized protein CC85DRAFT_305854 [Cutaneotrichosporon oleaginosum]KLT38556.1 hypothetical protein CC85DRAFT_305854 [Cutaneotrichosporon oleaginosum]TXT08478.1 hypothetical protein COLE_05402 [Cutaneotrichosporon oleaginosum]